MIRALGELGGPTSAANTYVGFLLQIATRYQRLYNLATAPLGYFNDDTSQFVEWLKQVLSSEDAIFREIDYALEQVRIAIYEPESDLGKRIRTIEAGNDPLFQRSGPWVCDREDPLFCEVRDEPGYPSTPGPWVYWEYLIAPTIWTSSRSIINVAASGFRQHIWDYGSVLLDDPFAYPDFGAYLASIEYDMHGRLPAN